MFKNISIIGAGFMGTSFALALKEKFPRTRIAGFARSQSSYKKLKKLNILDKVSKDLGAVVESSDLVVLSLPVYTIIEYFKKIRPFLKKDTIVIDLGSTKKKIENAASKNLSNPNQFIGCHPLCGGEKSGAKYADKDLYKNSLCVITASKKLKALGVIRKMWRSLGSSVYLMNAAKHDKIVSLVSHLPHVISFALIASVAKPYRKFSASSFQDITRIGTSPAVLWKDIFISNSENIVKSISCYIKNLQKYRSLIKKGEKKKLLYLIKKANKEIEDSSTQ